MSYSVELPFLVAEDLVLLVWDPVRGTRRWAVDLTPAIGAALLSDLVRTGVVVGDPGEWQRSRLTIEGDVPTDPLLAEAATRVARRPLPVTALLGVVGKGMQDAVLHRLVEREVLRTERGRLGGTRRPAVDTARRDAVHRDLVAVLVRDDEPSERVGDLVAVASATGIAARMVQDDGRQGGRTHSAIARAARTVERSRWAGLAVRHALDD